MSYHHQYFLGDAPFSVFDTMSRILDETPVRVLTTRRSDAAPMTEAPIDDVLDSVVAPPRWERCARMEHCQLILGNRFGIPYERLRCLPPPAKPRTKPWVNYFKGSHRLTLKGAMTKLLRAWGQTAEGADVAAFFPQSFVVGGSAIANPSQSSTSRRGTLSTLRAASVPVADERAALAEAMSKDRAQVWIVKPSAGSKGTGIFLTRDIAAVDAAVAKAGAMVASTGVTQAEGARGVAGVPPTTLESPCNSEDFSTAMARSSSSQCSPLQPASSGSFSPLAPDKKSAPPTSSLFVVQRYVANPYLVDGRKFDIRVWVQLVSPFDIYVFSQGSCRTASTRYSLGNIDDAYAHVTNHDLQQHSAAYGQGEPGNEMWYSQLQRYLDVSHAGAVDFARDIQPKINRIITSTMLAARDFLEVGEHEPFRCFQLFGYDLILDDALNVHLLEINGSPGAARRWLEPIVLGVIQTVVDPCFDSLTDAEVRPAQRRVDKAQADDGEVGTWSKIYSADLGPLFP